MKKVLVITSSIDETVSYMQAKYQNRVTFYRIDVDRFSEYSFFITSDGWRITKGNDSITESEVKSIYYRKPLLPDISEYHLQYHQMIQKDIITLINGLVDSFNGIVLTKPSILRKTENKIYQLQYAQKHGLKIPKSFIGNNNAIEYDYIKRSSIIKPLTMGKTIGENGIELYHTSKFSGFDGDISLTPVYLQEYIQKQYEVRVTIINNYIFPVRIDTDNKIDWRKDYCNHKYSLIKCPTSVKNEMLLMMKDMNLFFGAFDYIVTPDNEWVFLEINPNGQWLWLENSMHLDISKKIIEYLTS